MTSRVSFFDLMRENTKRRIWNLALLVLGFFLCMPLYTMRIIDMVQGSFETEQRLVEIIQQNVLEVLGRGNLFVVILTALGAVICGLTGFSYLLSKKKVDLYHGIPVKREKLFLSVYLNGIWIYLVPYILNIIITMVIYSGYQKLTGSMIKESIIAIAWNFLFFLFLYHVTIISLMLAGNFIMSIIFLLLFNFYFVVVFFISVGYMQMFFETYVTTFNGIPNWLIWSSPVMSYSYGIGSYMNNVSIDTLLLLQIFIMTVITGVLSLLLYKLRPSEAAGKSIAFPRIQGIVQVLLVIPATLGSAAIFRATSYRESLGWMIFGLIFGIVLSHGVLEILFHLDFKAIFLHKKQFLLEAGIVAFILIGGKLAIPAYNTYLPNEKDIASAAIFDWTGEYIEENENGEYYYIGYHEQLKRMGITEYQPIYELAKQGISYIKDDQNIEEFATHYIIKFKLKNGREIYRDYTIPESWAYEALKQLYDNPEYKKQIYPILRQSISYSKIEIVGNNYETYTLVKREEIDKFLEIYKEELSNLNLYTLDEIPVAELRGRIDWETGGAWNSRYSIYPSFTKTIEYLNTVGIQTEDWITEFNPEKIEEIRVTATGGPWIEHMENGDREIKSSEYYDEWMAVFSDPKEIQELADHLIVDSFLNNRISKNIPGMSYDLYIEVLYQTKDGIQPYNAVFYGKEIPDLVKKAFGVIEE